MKKSMSLAKACSPPARLAHVLTHLAPSSNLLLFFESSRDHSLYSLQSRTNMHVSSCGQLCRDNGKTFGAGISSYHKLGLLCLFPASQQRGYHCENGQQVEPRIDMRFAGKHFPYVFLSLSCFYSSLDLFLSCMRGYRSEYTKCINSLGLPSLPKHLQIRNSVHSRSRSAQDGERGGRCHSTGKR